MQKDMLRLIWDIRGKVDESINNHDLALYEKARAEFLNLKDSGKIYKTMSLETAGAGYVDEDSRVFDIESNYIIILHYLNELKKDVIGEAREDGDMEFVSAAGVLWIIREMYDVFILNAELQCVEEKENKELFSTIEKGLTRLLDYYKLFRGSTDMKEKITIIELFREVNNTFDKYYTEKLDSVED